MKKGYVFIACIALFSSIALTGCNENPSDIQVDVSTVTADTSFETADSEMFTDRDYRAVYDEATSIRISLSGTTASCASDTVQISDSIVTITTEGTYIISGVLDNGMIIVDAQDSDKLQIVLDGVSVTSETSASLYIKEADKVFVTLAENTQNDFINGGTYTAIDENNIDGTVFSKQDLTFNGSGTLNVSAPSGHGIVCKDDLVFTGGTYNVTASKHGIDANDSVRATNSNVAITAGKDGIHAENSDEDSLGFIYLSSGTFCLSSGDDGVSSGAFTQIQNGTFTVMSGTQASTDNTSLKGIKATTGILVNGGNFEISSSDDTVHSNASITIRDGNFLLNSGDDAFHADEVLSVLRGNINIERSYEGLEALKVEISGGDIRIVASDDGINSAGGTDSSGYGGMGDTGAMGGVPVVFGGHGGGARPGEQFGGNGSSSNGLIQISGGTIYIQASGDGIDSNGSLEITGGHVTVFGPTNGDTSVLDYDTTGTISGGTFCGSGASMMAQTLTGEGQGVLRISVSNQSAGTEIAVKDLSGGILLSYTPAFSFQFIVISAPNLVKGEVYTIVMGSTAKTVAAQ